MAQDASLQIDLGSVETLIGDLRFTFVVSREGDAYLQVDAGNPSNAGQSNTMVMLDANGYEKLKAIIRGADGMIDRLISEGRIKRMTLPY